MLERLYALGCVIPDASIDLNNELSIFENHLIYYTKSMLPLYLMALLVKIIQRQVAG